MTVIDDLSLLVDMVVTSKDEVNLRDALRQPDVVWRPHVGEGDNVLAS